MFRQCLVMFRRRYAKVSTQIGINHSRFPTKTKRNEAKFAAASSYRILSINYVFSLIKLSHKKQAFMPTRFLISMTDISIDECVCLCVY